MLETQVLQELAVVRGSAVYETPITKYDDFSLPTVIIIIIAIAHGEGRSLLAKDLFKHLLFSSGYLRRITGKQPVLRFVSYSQQCSTHSQQLTL